MEHGWAHVKTGRSGFIDLIASASDYVNLVIECKRPNVESWHFMNSKGSSKHVESSTWLKTGDREEVDSLMARTTKRVKTTAWGSGPMKPSCPEMDYCVMGDKAAKSALIEVVASELCLATEAYAASREHHSTSVALDYYYLPVIVTTATLKVVTADPDKISLADGKITDGKVDVVPFLKMTKHLVPPYNNAAYRSQAEAVKAMNRTVYVVNSNHLVEFLTRAGPNTSVFDSWPLCRI